MTREGAIHAVVREACFSRAGAASGDLAALFARHAVDPRDAHAMKAAAPRLALYRKLVRGNVVGVCEAILERGFAHLEAHAKGAWDAAVDAYLEASGPRTPHLRDVPSELVPVLLPRLASDRRVPPYVAELFVLELAEFRVGAAPDEPTREGLGDVAADAGVVLRGPSARLVCAHAVHLATVDPSAPPPPVPTHLFVHRDAAHEVRVVVLTPFADALLVRLLAGDTLGAAIAGAAAAHGTALTEGLLNEVAKWLADFGERGILLGAAR